MGEYHYVCEKIALLESQEQTELTKDLLEILYREKKDLEDKMKMSVEGNIALAIVFILSFAITFAICLSLYS